VNFIFLKERKKLKSDLFSQQVSFEEEVNTKDEIIKNLQKLLDSLKKKESVLETISKQNEDSACRQIKENEALKEALNKIDIQYKLLTKEQNSRNNEFKEVIEQNNDLKQELKDKQKM
jgi:hypothetical protein